MRARLSPANLDALSPAEAYVALVRRFPWMGKHADLLREALAWQECLQPRPNFYFRWHLPRLLWTIRMLQSCIQPAMEILDIAAYFPYSTFMERRCGGKWMRTTFEGGSQLLENRQGKTVIPSIQLDCDVDPWPVRSQSYDLAMI